MRNKNLKTKYNEILGKILIDLMKGKSIEEIERAYNYLDYKSLYLHMDISEFEWNEKTYKFKINGLNTIKEELGMDIPIKAGRIIKSLAKGTKDLRILAKEEGFKDHRELGSYMKKYKLYWNGDLGNYEYKSEIEVFKGDRLKKEEIKDEIKSFNQQKKTINNSSFNAQDKFKKNCGREEFLDLLYEYKEKIIDLLSIGNKNIPKYKVPGTTITKKIHMSHLLSGLLTNYSKINNISEREIVEVAIIEYLNNYGYEYEVSNLFK